MNKDDERPETEAYIAQKEVEKALYNENSYFYKPFQFANYDVKALTMKTTYDEIFLWGVEKAKIRKGWMAENNTVFIPNIFAKVNGVNKDIGNYWDNVYKLIERPNCLFIQRFPASRNYIKIDSKDYLKEVISEDGIIDDKKLVLSKYWCYGNLPMNIQKILSIKIKKIMESNILQNKYRKKEEVPSDTLGKLATLDEKFLELLLKFDYSDDVPSVVIYNNQISGGFTFNDAVSMELLNQLGFDIFIFNPTNSNDIENYLDSVAYDIHKLERAEFNLRFKKRSFFDKLF